MTDITFTTYLIVCPLVFLAGFIDSIAGGGGLISLPAYLFAGLPPHFAAGTNKVANCLGTSVSAVKYFTSGKVKLRAAIWSGLGAMAGGAAGSSLALYISEETLRLIVLIALPCVAIFLSTRKDFGSDEEVDKHLSPKKIAMLSVIIGFVLGGYDGLVGPGTGTFMILAFTGVLGLDLLTSSGCAKVSNLASNIASAAVFLMSGHVVMAVALPAAACAMLGNYIGAKTALKGGTKYVRAVMFVVLALLFGSIIIDLL